MHRTNGIQKTTSKNSDGLLPFNKLPLIFLRNLKKKRQLKLLKFQSRRTNKQKRKKWNRVMHRTKPNLTWKCPNKMKSHKAQFICPKWFKTMLYYTRWHIQCIAHQTHIVWQCDLLFQEDEYDSAQFITMWKKCAIFCHPLKNEHLLGSMFPFSRSNLKCQNSMYRE